MLGERAELVEGLAKVRELIGDGKGVAVLASTRDTCEELFALKTWAAAAGRGLASATERSAIRAEKERGNGKC